MEMIDLIIGARDLTEQEVLLGKVLNPTQKLYLRRILAELTIAQAVVDLNPNPEERASSELNRAFDGGKRAFILELLTDSDDAEIEIKQASPQP